MDDTPSENNACVNTRAWNIFIHRLTVLINGLPFFSSHDASFLDVFDCCLTLSGRVLNDLSSNQVSKLPIVHPATEIVCVSTYLLQMRTAYLSFDSALEAV